MTDATVSAAAAAANVVRPAGFMPDGSLDLNYWIGKFIALRAAKKAKAEEQATALKPYNEAMEQLEGALLGEPLRLNTKNIKTESGTIGISDKVTAVLDDPKAFREWCIEHKQWDAMVIRADAAYVEAYVEKNKTLPPGVRMSTFRSLSARKPNAKS